MVSSPAAITLDVGTSRENRTGSWRTERPVFVSLMPPCNDGQRSTATRSSFAASSADAPRQNSAENR
ncbi:MAG: hypothetical protein EPN99_09645 [Frankiales bacterium]|nr:MAG: hypothetical protein EPN99_09645 [Frankiales bacterium]